MKKPIVQVKNLVKIYGQGLGRVEALRGMEIEVYPQEFVIIFGPSGSGKSTLLNIISGLEEPTKGEVWVDGEDLTRLTPYQRAVFHRDKVGMVFQAYNLISSLTVMQNITLPLVFAKVPKRIREKRAKELLDEFGLSSLASRLPTEISGGQMQRVGIIRALINRPPLIIADEPTGNLDSVATHQVMKIFRQLNERYQTTVIVVTHDSSLFSYADRIVFILDGKRVKERVYHPRRKRKLKRIPFDRLLAQEKNRQKRKIWQLLPIFLSRSQLASLEEEELKRTVTLLERRIRKEITQKELFERLDRPLKAGGAGLYRATAQHLSETLELVLNTFY